MTRKAICVHVHMSDNRETLCDAENSCLPVDVDNMETLCDDKIGFVHVHVSDNNVSDNRETLCGAENSWLPVDVDNKETLCDDNSGLRACPRER